LPDHVLLFERVPQVELLARVDVMVSHGGNNTVNEALAAGRPLLVMPVGGEQGDNASRVVYLGTGLRARISGSPSSEIGEKVRRLIEEPSFSRKALGIARSLARTAGPGVAARFVEYLAANRRPMVRPPGYPLTVLSDTPGPWEGTH
jgi:UDP:flavonoid glycosyltransferase YjiC (YdhE family)